MAVPGPPAFARPVLRKGGPIEELAVYHVHVQAQRHILLAASGVPKVLFEFLYRLLYMSEGFSVTNGRSRLKQRRALSETVHGLVVFGEIFIV